MPTMTYYGVKSSITNEEKIIARSYQTERGIIFDEGSRFERCDPVTNLHGFFTIRHMSLENRKELNREVKRIKRENSNMHTTFFVEEYEYR